MRRFFAVSLLYHLANCSVFDEAACHFLTFDFTTALPQAHPKNTQVPLDFLSSASDCRSAEDLPVTQNDAKCFKAPWFQHLFICFSLFTFFYFHESERGFGSLVVKWHLLISIAGPIVHTLHPSAPQPCRSLSVAWLSPASAGLGHEVIKSLSSKRHGSFPAFPNCENKWKHGNNWNMDGLWCRLSVRGHKGSNLGWG